MILDVFSNHQRYHGLHPNLAKALQYLATHDFAELPTGRHDIDGDNIFAIVDQYQPRDPQTTRFEAHEVYADIQCVLVGEETALWHPLENRQPDYAYNAARDFAEFDAAPLMPTCQAVTVKAGMFAIFFPEDIHMPAMQPGTEQVKKVVMKVKIA